jgi:hypothetical protein
MNRANRSEQGSTCRERSEPDLERLLCTTFDPNQPSIATNSFFWALSLSRLCMRCSLELLASRPRPKPKRKTTSHSLSCDSCTTSHQLTQISLVHTVPGEPRTLVLRIIRAAPSPRLTSVPQTPIVASSNLLNIWDMLESCKIVGYR